MDTNPRRSSAFPPFSDAGLPQAVGEVAAGRVAVVVLTD
jgi:hypothetical protein